MRTGLEMIEVILTINNLDIEVLAQETVRIVALKSINRMVSTMVPSQKSSVPRTQTNILVFLLSLSMRKLLNVVCSSNYTYLKPKRSKYWRGMIYSSYQKA